MRLLVIGWIIAAVGWAMSLFGLVLAACQLASTPASDNTEKLETSTAEQKTTESSSDAICEIPDPPAEAMRFHNIRNWCEWEVSASCAPLGSDDEKAYRQRVTELNNYVEKLLRVCSRSFNRTGKPAW